MNLTKTPAPVEIRRQLGTLPPLWSRPVIFVANLLGLFFGNDQETGVLREQVGPLETYGGRVVPILDLLFHGSHTNLVVLEHAPVPGLLEYFSQILDLRLPDVTVLSPNQYRSLAQGDPKADPSLSAFLEQLGKRDIAWVDGFVTDDVLERLALMLNKETISPLRASRIGNNKMRLHEFLVETGLPVFDTETAADSAQVSDCLKALRRMGYDRAAVKAQIGASGIGIMKVDTSLPTLIPEYLFFEGPCLVQGWLDGGIPGVTLVGSPSVQLFLDESSLNLYDLTEQILSADSIHEGNIAPPAYLKKDPATKEELMRQAEVVGRWLHAQGYRGTASVDFHVVERQGQRETRVCEINARVTGATYPSILARHFMPSGAWLMRNLRFATPLLSSALIQALHLAGLLYQPGGEFGILPINFNTDQDGRAIKGQFLCLSRSTEEAWEILDRARRLLPVHGEFDRD